MPEFEKDEIAYLSDGTKVQVLYPHAGGWLAQVLLKVSDDDYDDAAYVVEGEIIRRRSDELFKTPPIAEKQEKVKELDELIYEKKQELLRIRSDVVNVERDYKATLERLKAYEPLKNLELFLEGKITHVVVKRTGQVFTPEQWVDGDSYRRKLRLLTLGGTLQNNGEVDWCLNAYADGSGGDYEVLLCASEEEAREKAKAALYKRCKETSGTRHIFETLLEDFKRAKLDPPQDYLDRVNHMRAMEARSSVEHYTKALAEAQEKLEQATAKGE